MIETAISLSTRGHFRILKSGHFKFLLTPVEKWHAMIGDPTLADAILDRLVHNAYKINLKGESMRKQKKTLTTMTPTES